jgi:Fe-S cluster assembly ATP-binding protein
MLEVNSLETKIDDQRILKGLSLVVKPGQIHALMGPNGSGKSTLSQAIMGNPMLAGHVKGKILLNKKDITEASPDERAQLGLFLSFQTPIDIPGVKFSDFLKQAYTEITGEQIEVEDFLELLKKEANRLKLSADFIDRELNVGLSGGEKKKMEMLQMLVLKPKYIIVDEVDSGLDIDAVREVAKVLGEAVKEGAGLLIITHYKRILEYVKPDKVSIIKNGKIVKEGGAELVEELEDSGYAEVN